MTRLDALLLAGGELTWAAGPLRKGANLCHGTAGNGLALLKLFARTADERWLERARRFAMHAAAQVGAARREHGARALQPVDRRRRHGALSPAVPCRQLAGAHDRLVVTLSAAAPPAPAA